MKALALVAALAMAACGGGGGSGASSTTLPTTSTTAALDPVATLNDMRAALVSLSAALQRTPVNGHDACEALRASLAQKDALLVAPVPARAGVYVAKAVESAQEVADTVCAPKGGSALNVLLTKDEVDLAIAAIQNP